MSGVAKSQSAVSPREMRARLIEAAQGGRKAWNRECVVCGTKWLGANLDDCPNKECAKRD